MRDKTSSPPPQLGLRNNAHQVQVIVPNGSTQPVLGTRHPAPENRRAVTIEQAGGTRPSPREQDVAAIELPLPVRTQTILNRRLPLELRARVNGGIASQKPSRLENADGETETLE